MDKLLKKLQENPKNVSIRDMETVLARHGFYKKSQKGSHAKYRSPFLKQTFIFPHRSPVKEIYVKELFKKLNYEI